MVDKDDKGVISIFGVEPEYPEEEEKEGEKTRRRGRKRPDIIDPYGWCSYESTENKKIKRIYKDGKLINTFVNGVTVK